MITAFSNHHILVLAFKHPLHWLWGVCTASLSIFWQMAHLHYLQHGALCSANVKITWIMFQYFEIKSTHTASVSLLFQSSYPHPLQYGTICYAILRTSCCISQYFLTNDRYVFNEMDIVQQPISNGSHLSFNPYRVLLLKIRVTTLFRLFLL